MDNQDWTPVIIRRPPTKEEIKEKQMQKAEGETPKSYSTKANVTATGQPAWKIEAQIDGEDGKGLKRTPKEEAQKIVSARVAMKLSQAALAQRCNIQAKTIQEIESGKAFENRAILAKIKKTLGVS